MTSNNKQVNQLPYERQVDYWQRTSELEEGRNQVLRMVASGKPLQAILNVLCQKAQIYNPELFCSVLTLEQDKSTLHPTASASLPVFYCDALEGVEIGLGVGSCGTAAFTKKRTIVEDINTHPYWVQYKALALEAGLQACWSEPIIGEQGQVFGTFAIYYAHPKAPNEEDLKFIELSANLAAVVYENACNKEKLLTANNLLSKTIDERTEELEQANAELANLIKLQEQQHITNVGVEKSAMANALLSGFAHEINTPIGIALTSASTAQDKIEMLCTDFKGGVLSKSVFLKIVSDLEALIGLNKGALERADNLLNQFKTVQSDKIEAQRVRFNIREFMESLKQSLSDLIGQYNLYLDVVSLEVSCDRESLWQVFYQLIENSILHGFDQAEKGNIHISITPKSRKLVINYQDDGVGVDKDQASRLFDPFYTTKAKSKNMGLGMTTVHNLLANVLHGKIQTKPSPVGIRFEITLPLTE